MIRLNSLLFVSLLLTACANVATGPAGIESLEALKNMSQSSTKQRTAARERTNHIRRSAVQEAAMTTSAQAGLAARTKEINAILAKHAANLDHVYNFNALLLNHNILPPVLAQAESTLKLDDNQTLRIADRTYRIQKQARFVTTTPNWRDFLWQKFSPPSKPHKIMLPKNSEEQAVWDEYVTKGWKQGIEQADRIFVDNLARITADMKGMVLYRVLLAQNMVSPPYTAKTNLGVTGDSNKLRVNDQVLRITALPALQTRAETWKPAVSPR